MFPLIKKFELSKNQTFNLEPGLETQFYIKRILRLYSNPIFHRYILTQILKRDRTF